MSDRQATELKALILSLETMLMDPILRKDRERASALLAEDFREFGSSGQFWTRNQILDELAAEPAYTPPVIEDFAIRQLSPDAILATYRTVRPASPELKATLRSSIWIQHENRWQMLFHQATKAADP